MTPEYLAGFFDGEGCINITVRGKSGQVSLRVMLVNTDAKFLQKVQEQFGGNFYIRTHKGKGHWKRFCEVVWTGHAAASFLETIGPYLILKKPQAKLAGEFWIFMQRPKTERCVSIHMPLPNMPNRIICRRKPETIKMELDFKAKMHQLNRRGLTQFALI